MSYVGRVAEAALLRFCIFFFVYAYNLLSVRNLSIPMHYVEKASEVSGAFMI
jgi:hypothetical protein